MTFWEKYLLNKGAAKMKFIEDVDTGELIPVPDDAEDQIYDEMPTLYKDEPADVAKDKYKVDSGSANLVDVIFNLQDELKEEKGKKTVYHKFPFVKIISAVAICAALVVGCVLGIRYVSSIDFKTEPIKIETPAADYSERSDNEISEKTNYDTAEDTPSSEDEKRDEYIDNIFFLSSTLAALFAISFVMKAAMKLVRG